MIYNKNEDSTNWYGRSFLVFLTWAQVDICKMIESRLHNDNPHQRRVKGESQRGRFAALGRRSMFSSFKESFHHYLMNSTLHGLKYVGDRNITRFERYFFALTFLLVLILSTYFITHIWTKWRQSPLIITQSAITIPVEKLPFPAVTICNMNQAQKSAVKLLKGNEENAILQSICRHSVNTQVVNSVNGTWESYREVLMKVSQSCEKMLVSCSFGHVHVNCTKIFSNILTDGGLCCIFNGLHKKFMMKLGNQGQFSEKWDNNEHMDSMANNWTPETGFHSKKLMKNHDAYPRPGLGSGNHLGLTLVLNTAVDEYYCSSTSSYGFKVLVHSPHELPQAEEYGLGIANGYESRIVTTPIIARASQAVRNIPMKIRQCIFESENDLSLYRIYSRRNCQSECQAKNFHKVCNCILYYMPRLYENITICGRSDSKCIDKVRDEIHVGTNDSFKCDCPYGCHDIKFDMELSSTPIFEEAPLLKHSGLLAGNASILQIYYQRGFYRSQDKEELIGFTEFLSNIGGLLGLFMGFSIFSIVEIVYFFSIRPYCNCMKEAQRRRQNPEPCFQRFNDIPLRRLNFNNIDNSASTTTILF